MAQGALAACQSLLLIGLFGGNLDMTGHAGLELQILSVMHHGIEGRRLATREILMAAGSGALGIAFLAVDLMMTDIAVIGAVCLVVEHDRLLCALEFDGLGGHVGTGGLGRSCTQTHCCKNKQGDK